MSKAPLHLFLDTEVFKRDPHRRKGPFRAISALARRRRVRLHTSEVCLSEFRVERNQLITEAIERLHSAIAKAKFIQPLADEPLLDLVISDLPAIASAKRGAMEESLETWIKEQGLTIHKVRPPDAERIIRLYFEGEPPFQRPRNRADFPDAFIFLALQRMAGRRKHVTCISNDAGFRRACESAAIDCHDSIETFLTESGLLSELRTGHLEAQMEALALILREGGIQRRLSELAKEQLVGQRMLIFYPVETRATVVSADDLAAAFPDQRLGYFGSGLVKVPFSARTMVDLRVEAPLDRVTAKGELSELARADDVIGGMLRRMIVFKADLLINMNPTAIEEEARPDDIRRELETAQLDLDDLIILPSPSDTKNVYSAHAMDQARAELAAGNLEVELEADEERDRLARARWVGLPEELHGVHEGFELGPQSRFLIAPMPRFESWVRLFKKELLEAEQGADQDAEAPDGR